MKTMRFAVTHIMGNDETVIRTFPEEEKQQAIEYGKIASESKVNGVIACIKALFDDNNNRADNKCLVYEVWE